MISAPRKANQARVRPQASFLEQPLEVILAKWMPQGAAKKPGAIFLPGDVHHPGNKIDLRVAPFLLSFDGQECLQLEAPIEIDSDAACGNIQYFGRPPAASAGDNRLAG